MSNSRRKNPIFPNCQAASEKKEKLRANRKLRRLVSEKLKSGETGIPNLKEISDSWYWSKDGKTYHQELTKKQLSK